MSAAEAPIKAARPHDLTPIKAAAFDAAAAALEIRSAAGALIAANAAGAAAIEHDPAASPREEQVVAGRTRLIERCEFTFEGEQYRVSAALDIASLRKLQDDLFARAYFDGLTGLPNRELCDQTIADLIQTRSPDQSFAVVMIDLDRFGQINAFHGAQAGDTLLAMIGERIVREIGPQDMVARTAGDEFCLILGDVGISNDVLRHAERLITRICEPYVVEGVEIFTTAVAGASLWPRDGSTPDMLRHKAKAAVADAKGSNGAVRLFEPELERAELARARVDNALRSAIRERRIGCAFQLKYDFRAEAIDSLEVLMRWRDDDGVWSTPGAFLDLAHQIGLINDITRQVFEETITSIDAINEAFGRNAAIGFNIAARQAGDTRFMRGFLDRLAMSGHAARFVLELTEEAFLPGSQFQSRVLPMIREIGAKISIDDFGAGYSSLATLADITADEVKVDRSLITAIDQRPRSQSLLKAIESIGESLGAEVMVEGVETAEELAYLRQHTKIRVAQGFYFAKPLLLEEVEGGVEQRARAAAALPLSQRIHRLREGRDFGRTR